MRQSSGKRMPIFANSSRGLRRKARMSRGSDSQKWRSHGSSRMIDDRADRSTMFSGMGIGSSRDRLQGARNLAFLKPRCLHYLSDNLVRMLADHLCDCRILVDARARLAMVSVHCLPLDRSVFLRSPREDLFRTCVVNPQLQKILFCLFDSAP